MKGTEFNFIIGGGINTKIAFIFDLRYTLGLLSIVNSDSIPEINDEIPDDYNFKNGVISIMIEYSF